MSVQHTDTKTSAMHSGTPHIDGGPKGDACHKDGALGCTNSNAAGSTSGTHVARRINRVWYACHVVLLICTGLLALTFSYFAVKFACRLYNARADLSDFYAEHSNVDFTNLEISTGGRPNDSIGHERLKIAVDVYNFKLQIYRYTRGTVLLTYFTFIVTVFFLASLECLLAHPSKQYKRTKLLFLLTYSVILVTNLILCYANIMFGVLLILLLFAGGYFLRAYMALPNLSGDTARLWLPVYYEEQPVAAEKAV